jgi:hypothetical protein
VEAELEDLGVLKQERKDCNPPLLPVDLAIMVAAEMGTLLQQ